MADERSTEKTLENAAPTRSTRKGASAATPPPPAPEPRVTIDGYILARKIGRRAQLISRYIARQFGGDGVEKTLAEWDKLHGQE